MYMIKFVWRMNQPYQFNKNTIKGLGTVEIKIHGDKLQYFNRNLNQIIGKILYLNGTILHVNKW